MCIDIATLSLAGQIVGGVLGAVGTVGQISSQNAITAYQAQVAQNNAKIAERNARQIEGAGVRQQTEEIWKGRAFLGRQRASLGASGLDVGGGSAFDVATGTRRIVGRSVENVQDQTRTAAYNQRVIGSGFQNEAGLLRSQANQGSLLPALGSLLGTATSVGKSYLDYRNTGVPMNGLELVFG